MTIQESVKKTYKYSSFFDSSLSSKELHHWLVTLKKNKISDIPPLLIKKISEKEAQKRKLRLKVSQNKKLYAKSKLNFLNHFPLVWFVGITGSVSVDNAKKKDDIDIFLITAPFALWLIRPFVLLYLEVLGIRRNKNTKSSSVKNLICPNLWLDANNLFLNKERQNLFTAHEVLQVFPLINKNSIHQQFILKNTWIKKYLANAYNSSIHRPASGSSLRMSASGGRQESININNSIYFLLAPLNLIFFLLQYLFMLPRRKGEEVGWGRAFFHDSKFQNKVLKNLA